MNGVASPVVFEPDLPVRRPESGIALCLSGGGYRAMLFHLGALWRLNELRVLRRLDRISSVSGGSITSAALALAWPSLAFDEQGVGTGFVDHVVRPVRDLASRTIDLRSVVTGILTPSSIGERIARAYSQHIFGHKTLQDLPDRPRFVFNATNLQSGVLWRFMKPYMRDYRVGEVRNPTIPVAQAVAASAAFPPFLSPVRLKLREADFSPPRGEPLHHKPYTTDVHLTDGGVYDNLGLETAWKRYDTILISDAGGQMAPEATPNSDWLRQVPRLITVIDNQVRSLRKRQAIDAFKSGERNGAYWGIRTNIEHYGLADVLPCPAERTTQLATTPTRLAKLSDATQEMLINWGYAVCDAAMRKHVAGVADRAPTFPYPARGVGA